MVIQIGSAKYSFASALAQILNSFQNLLPIIYILGSRELYNACIDKTETTTNTHCVLFARSVQERIKFFLEILVKLKLNNT